jgi:hypothetical protein
LPFAAQHRLILAFEAELEGVGAAAIVQRVLESA